MCGFVKFICAYLRAQNFKDFFLFEQSQKRLPMQPQGRHLYQKPLLGSP